MQVISKFEDLKDDARILMLISGGFDSVSCAIELLKRGINTIGLTIDYPERPGRERETVALLSNRIGLRLMRVSLTGVHDARHLFPELSGSRHEAWFPFRNLLFVSIACNVAVAVGCDTVAMGVRIWDTTAYSDATLDYFAKTAELLASSGYTNSKPIKGIFLPHIGNHDVARTMYMQHPEILNETWSCWREAEVPCGVCAPCKTRHAFLSEIIK